jgi:hypothetical protein
MLGILPSSAGILSTFSHRCSFNFASFTGHEAIENFSSKVLRKRFLGVFADVTGFKSFPLSQKSNFYLDEHPTRTIPVT